MTGSSFEFTPKQLESQEVMGGPATHILAEGGSRSGKTFLEVHNIALRGLRAAGSRHAILRYRFNHVKVSVIQDTFPKVMKTAFPSVPYHMDRSDWFAKLPNGSEIWFGGLDEKERTEKVLGQEYATILFNEVSQIPWDSYQIAITRLAQRATRDDGKLLKLRAYYDCNPPSKAHWAYKLFVLKVDPETGKPLKNPDDYARFRLNPHDNKINLSPEYLGILEGLSARMRLRFLEGQWADATPGQLFLEEVIERWRELGDGKLPQFVRVVVAVDPSGSGDTDNADNDEIGISVVGLGTDGNAYVLEDASIKAGPATWGRIAASAFDRYEADVVVGEGNFGGDMVRHVIQTARPRTPFKKVTASRGKHVRAEPFAALYEQGKVRHVGEFRELEGELVAFNTAGYIGEGSPNRADALIWALAELFPGLVRPSRKEVKKADGPVPGGAHAWMG